MSLEGKVAVVTGAAGERGAGRAIALMFAEAGAGRIPDNHHWTRRYVDEFGLELVPFFPDQGHTIKYFRGQRIKVEPGERMDLSKLYSFIFCELLYR